MSRETVVITGVGIVSAIGIGESAFFDALLSGKSGVRSLGDRTDGDSKPGPDDEIDGVWIGAPIIDFEPKQHVRPRKALKVMCREIQTSFASAYLALTHAGLSDQIPAAEDGPVTPDRVGAVYGSEIFFNPPEELLSSMKLCEGDDGQVDIAKFGQVARKEIMPLWMLKYLPNMPACQVGISINAQGPNNSLVLGDVSGPAALLEADSYLQRGLADVMMVGATGTRIGSTRLSYRGDPPIPSRNGNALEEVSRPHDPHASGVVGGEAAVSLVMETAEHASKRNAPVLACVLASASRFCATPAMKHDARSNQLESAQSREASAAIKLAIDAVLKQAALEASQVGLVVSHAMGDRQADAGESKALSACRVDAPVVAVMASVGHTGAASGMLGVATGALAIGRGVIPPTLNRAHDCPVNLLDSSQPLESPYVLCLSFTNEGSAMAVLLGPASA